MKHGLGRMARIGLVISVIFVAALSASATLAAPYAALVMDARTGEVIHSRNADTRLHPASLTKMMTLYIAFEAIERGEISLDTQVRISRKAASEPPSKLGLKEGQRISLRHLIRAAAVKSANDAATAIGEAIEGSEAAFARRMNRTAKAIGMTRTTFKNANGLTEEGHLSTARDMTILGRHLFYDYPEYYNIFSRQTADAGIRQVSNTNRRFLSNYRGADGIKTGYTRAAGFNLVASAERGGERIIATVFGGRSTASRNQEVARLLDLGFRQAPSRVAVRVPPKPVYGPEGQDAGQTRTAGLIDRSPRPMPRPGRTSAPATDVAVMAALQDGIADTIADLQADAETDETGPLAVAEGDEADIVAVAALAAVAAVAQPMSLAEPETSEEPDAADPVAVAVAEVTSRVTPKPRPANVILASATPATEPVAEVAVQPVMAEVKPLEVVTRLSTSGGRHFGINVGSYSNRSQAEKVLLKTALIEMATLDEALRKVVKTSRGFDANFVGMSEEQAAMACRRLAARNVSCTELGPG